MITNETTGVWELDDVYKKANKGVYPYVGAPTLFAFGRNTNGQLGQNNTTYYSSPVQVPGITWSSASGGLNHSLALKALVQ